MRVRKRMMGHSREKKNKQQTEDSRRLTERWIAGEYWGIKGKRRLRYREGGRYRERGMV